MDFTERYCKQRRYKRLNHIRFYKNNMDIAKITLPMLIKIVSDLDCMITLEADKLLNESISSDKKTVYQNIKTELESLKTYFNNEKVKRG